MTPAGAHPQPLVLVVEDDAGIRDSVVECLASEGYRVAAAGDGADALARLRAGPRPDLVLADLVMPRMNGAELVERMRADPALRDVPVVLMTAATGAPGEAPGANALLRKPFDLDELLAVVGRASRPASGG